LKHVKIEDGIISYAKEEIYPSPFLIGKLYSERGEILYFLLLDYHIEKSSVQLARVVAKVIRKKTGISLEVLKAIEINSKKVRRYLMFGVEIDNEFFKPKKLFSEELNEEREYIGKLQGTLGKLQDTLLYAWKVYEAVKGRIEKEIEEKINETIAQFDKTPR
jgi:hypothetical protein